MHSGMSAPIQCSASATSALMAVSCVWLCLSDSFLECFWVACNVACKTLMIALQAGCADGCECVSAQIYASGSQLGLSTVRFAHACHLMASAMRSSTLRVLAAKHLRNLQSPVSGSC